MTETPRSIAVVAPSLEILGGQGVQARALMKALAEDGYRVSLIPINPRFPAALRSIRSVPYLRTLLNELLYLPGLLELRRADVVHVFSASYWSFLLAPIPAIAAAKLCHKPVVLHYHSGEADDHLTRWGRVVTPWLRLVDEIVVPSRYLQSVFARFGFRTVVVPNLVDLSQFRHRERRALRPRLLSVRNLEPHYGVGNTIEAFALLKAWFPAATLTIAGYGSEGWRLRGLVDRRKLTGIRFLGRVEPERLPASYDDADVFVNSSTIDNQPVSILEAFAAGLPVVSTPTGDIANMLHRGDAGLLVPTDDPHAMAQAVGALLDDPDLARHLTMRARVEVERYTWSHIRERWADVYRTVWIPSRRDILQRQTRWVQGAGYRVQGAESAPEDSAPSAPRTLHPARSTETHRSAEVAHDARSRH